MVPHLGAAQVLLRDDPSVSRLRLWVQVIVSYLLWRHIWKGINSIYCATFLFEGIKMLSRILIKGVREGLGRAIVFANFVTQPKPTQRSSEAQAQVNEEARRLSLYQFYACPFCVKTRRSIHQLNVPIELRDAKSGIHRDELEREGGRVKVPCLRIEEAESVRWLYESDDIISYLNQRFAQTQAR